MNPVITALIRILLCSAMLPALSGCAGHREGSEASATDAMLSLHGASWNLVRIRSAESSVHSPRAGSEYSLRFHPDGSLSLVVDCNRGSGTWRFDPPSQLDFGPLALTKALCPDMALHQRFTGELGRVASFVQHGDRLELSTQDGATVLEFTRH